MKSITSAMQTHLQGEVTTLATCWKLTRLDSTVMGFTDHDRDIEFDGVVYEASTGFQPTSLESKSNLSVDNMELVGFIDAVGITEEDLLAGRYDFAEVEVFMVNYEEPNATFGSIPMAKGVTGEVKFMNGGFSAEFRSLSQHLQQVVGENYSPLCRADLGDSRCQVDLGPFTHTGAVSVVTSNRQFTTDLLVESDDWFQYGLLTFTTGENAGLSMEVNSYITATGEFTLIQPMVLPVQPGDQFSVHAGCDKSIQTCINKFDNVVNFRGEPHVPGQKALTYVN